MSFWAGTNGCDRTEVWAQFGDGEAQVGYVVPGLIKRDFAFRVDEHSERNAFPMECFAERTIFVVVVGSTNAHLRHKSGGHARIFVVVDTDPCQSLPRCLGVQLS